ncbi:MAG: spore cortex biosynthesis protein YabQ [Clostridia bacterium]|nr:spore cortex biosynthesis protein YabQ [Clostridia bacterium]
MSPFAQGLLLALWSAACGGSLCAVYDVFRLFRTGRKPGGVRLFFADLLYCVFVYAAFALLFFNLTHGKVRWFAFAFAAGGFGLWRITVSRLFMPAAGFIIKTLKKALSQALKYIRRTARSLYRAAHSRALCRGDIKKARRGYGYLKRSKTADGKEKDKAQQSYNQDFIHPDIHLSVHIGDQPSGADPRPSRRARQTRRRTSVAAGQH